MSGFGKFEELEEEAFVANYMTWLEESWKSEQIAAKESYYFDEKGISQNKSQKLCGFCHSSCFVPLVWVALEVRILVLVGMKE